MSDKSAAIQQRQEQEKDLLGAGAILAHAVRNEHLEELAAGQTIDLKIGPEEGMEIDVSDRDLGFIVRGFREQFSSFEDIKILWLTEQNGRILVKFEAAEAGESA